MLGQNERMNSMLVMAAQGLAPLWVRVIFIGIFIGAPLLGMAALPVVAWLKGRKIMGMAIPVSFLSLFVLDWMGLMETRAANEGWVLGLMLLALPPATAAAIMAPRPGSYWARRFPRPTATPADGEDLDRLRCAKCKEVYDASTNKCPNCGSVYASAAW